MRRFLFIVPLTVIFILCHISLANAQNEVTVRNIGDSKSDIFGGFAPQCHCYVGNLHSFAHSVKNFIRPPESYKLAFDPRSGCGDCAPGFQVRIIHIILQTSGPCSLTVGTNVESALFPNSPDCPEPGPMICEENKYCIKIPAEGLWDVSIPTHCVCMGIRLKYLLGVHILESSCSGGAVPELMTDSSPSYCTNWKDDGSGWRDLLVDYPDWPGNLLIYADAFCCGSPVPTDNRTWGAIKVLYEK